MTEQPESDFASNDLRDTDTSNDFVSPSTSTSNPMDASWSGGERERFAALMRIASEISGRVNAILDPDEILRVVIPLLKEGFDLYYVHIYLLDMETRELHLRAGYGEAGEKMLARGHKISVDAERSLVARAARTKAPVTVNDVSVDPHFLSNPLLPDTASEMALPMVIADDVLGVFDIQHHEVDFFTPIYQDVFFTLAGQIATALQNARFVQQVERSLSETRIRFEVGQALNAAMTEEQVLSAIVAQAAETRNVCVFLLLYEDAEDGPAFVVSRRAPLASGIDLPVLQINDRIPAPDLSLFRMVSDGALCVTQQAQEDDRLLPDLRDLLQRSDVQGLAILPLIRQEQWLGLLVVMTQDPAYLDTWRQFRLRVLVEQGAMSLRQARLRDQLNLTQFSVNQAPAAILWIRPDGTLHSVNDTACELLGYSRSELLALPEMSRLDPNMIPSVWNFHWRKVKAEKRFIIETEYRTKSGRLIPMEVTVNYLQYGDQEFNYVFARDISERKQAESMRERFTIQLRTAADIAEQVGAILDPDDLLNTVIPLLKERFDLYHAHIYVLDGDDLVLRAGYGRIGHIMVQQGHKIALNHPRSLVARAARTRQIVAISDVSKAPDFLPNMLLPKTRSEVAVPIVIGDRVLGVFDVQSDQLDFFAPSDLDVFRTLSGQLANAFYSATLFEQQSSVREEYRNSAETVRAIFNAMTEGITVTDMMGRIVDLNDAALVLFGYDDRDELLNRSVMELVTQTGWPRMAAAMRQTLDAGEGQVHEYLMVRKDGNTFDAEQSTALLWDAENNPQGVVMITRDVTESKRARQEIARFEALAGHAVDAIVMADLSGNIIYANRASYRLFDYDPAGESMIGMSLLALWPKDHAHLLLEQALPQAGAEGWQGEAPQLRSGGDTFDAALTFFSVLGDGGEPISVATIVRDITARKQAEADLQRFALQLRTAADVSATITAILDPTALLEAIVPLVQERFGLYHLHVYTLDEAGATLVMRVGSGEAGRMMREEGHTIALERRPSLVAKAARTREIVLVDDVTQEPSHMPNPLLPDTRTEIAIPMLAGDEVIGVFDVQDVTPGRFSQSEVDVFHTLAGQIGIALRNARYFEDIQEVADNLREIDRLKSEFLANMSHELRTPLNSILGYAEVMLMGIDGELTPSMEEDAEAIFENGQQLLQLINDILDLTKIEAGRMTLDKKPLAVTPLLEEVKTNSQGLLHKYPKPVEILVVSDGNLPEIVADRVRIAQILNNLVSNAIKFTDEGYVRIRAHHDVAVDRVCIEVQDTGVGIAPQDLEHLFERFRQVDGSSTRRAEGTGLGLAITKHLVEMHGGDLTVESHVHEGSLFKFCLPVSGAPDGADNL